MLFDPKHNLEQQRQEIQTLLEPIPGDSAAGIDPGVSDTAKADVRQLEAMFGECLAVEKRNWKNEGYREPEPVAWQATVNDAAKYLAKTSKNLVLATLVAEAGLRLLGVRGLTLGTELMTGLADRYWPNAFPSGPLGSSASSGDLSSKKFAAWEYAYEWPDRIASRIDRLVMLTSQGTRVADYFEGLRLDTPGLDPEIRQKRINKGTKPIDKIKSDLLQAPERTKALFEDVVRCQEELQKLENVIQAKCVSPDPADPFYPPPVNAVREKIEEVGHIVRNLVPDLLPIISNQSEISSDQNAGPVPGQGSAPPFSPDGITRELAFSQLTQLAAFFRRTEPHSPISYALDQTVRWGRMSLPDLLTELIANTESRKAMFERTGLPLPKENESNSA